MMKTTEQKSNNGEKPSFDELESRIQSDIDYFNGELPEQFTIVWYGYLAALIEWGLISVSDHEHLVKLLPYLDDNPSVAILLGRPDKT